MRQVEVFTEGDVKLPYKKVSDEFFHSIALAVLEYTQTDNVTVTIILTDNQYIKNINSEYRGKDYPTDVISFEYRDQMFPVIDGVAEELGDVYISLEKAEEQSAEFEVTFKDELKRLLIHGILHLLGYDHERSDDDERIMTVLEEEIFDKIKT